LYYYNLFLVIIILGVWSMVAELKKIIEGLDLHLLNRPLRINNNYLLNIL